LAPTHFAEGGFGRVYDCTLSDEASRRLLMEGGGVRGGGGGHAGDGIVSPPSSPPLACKCVPVDIHDRDSLGLAHR